MNYLTSEEIDKTLADMEEIREQIKHDPALVERLWKYIKEVPAPHPLTPKQRYEQLMNQGKKSDQNGASEE